MLSTRISRTGTGSGSIVRDSASLSPRSLVGPSGFGRPETSPYWTLYDCRKPNIEVFPLKSRGRFKIFRNQRKTSDFTSVTSSEPPPTTLGFYRQGSRWGHGSLLPCPSAWWFVEWKCEEPIQISTFMGVNRSG